MPANRAILIEIEASGLSTSKPHRLNKLGKLGPLPEPKKEAAPEPVVEAAAPVEPPPPPAHKPSRRSSRKTEASEAVEPEGKIEE
jgi:hypothetical protein